MKRILIVIDSLGSGGAEKSLINLLSFIDYTKFSVDLALFGRGGINEKFVPKEVKFLPLIHPKADAGILRKLAFLTARIRFSVSLRLNKPRTANDQTIRYWKFFERYLSEIDNTYDVAFAYAQRLPTMFTAEKVRAKRKYSWINVTIHHDDYLRNFYLKFLKKFERIVCVSDDVQHTVHCSYPEFNDKTTVIYDIINPQFIRKLSNEYIPFEKSDKVINILTVARINYEQKGYDLLLESCRILKERGYHFKWRSLGNGEKEEDVRNLINKYKLEDCFELCGIHSNPYPYFVYSDVYVQTSRYEGYGLSIAEARLLGVPVVTTPYDCVALQIKGGINGIISTFDPNDIADSIATLIDNKALYASIKSNLTNDNIGNLTEFSKIERLIDYED